jgi:hypothetical protein
MNQWIQMINDSSLSIEQRTHAAAHLWDELRLAQNALRFHRTELISLLKDQKSLVIDTPNHHTQVLRDHTSLSIDHLSPEELKSLLGEDLYTTYIAHSHTLRWSRFKDAPIEIQNQLKQIATSKESIKIIFQSKAS